MRQGLGHGTGDAEWVLGQFLAHGVTARVRGNLLLSLQAGFFSFFLFSDPWGVSKVTNCALFSSLRLVELVRGTGALAHPLDNPHEQPS